MMAIELYGAGLAGDGPVVVRDEAGSGRRLPLEHWIGPAGVADERVLQRARGPVLDVGCGPGRHLDALARRGIEGLGVDVSPVAVRLARERGATVLRGSIFDRVPGAGRWNTALLLDGNVGIGGRPAALLARLALLLAPGGAVIAELDPPGAGIAGLRLRLEAGHTRTEWFAWAQVGADAIERPARAAGLGVRERWHDDGRWFAELARP